MKDVDYTKGAPPDYLCSGCGAHGVKLWRQYQTVASAIKLLCVTCAIADQKQTGSSAHIPKSPDDFDANGRWKSEYGWCDQIAWLVPAVPDEDGVSFWGYTSVPQAGLEWWCRLPNILPSCLPIEDT